MILANCVGYHWLGSFKRDREWAANREEVPLLDCITLTYIVVFDPGARRPEIFSQFIFGYPRTYVVA